MNTINILFVNNYIFSFFYIAKAIQSKVALYSGYYMNIF